MIKSFSTHGVAKINRKIKLPLVFCNFKKIQKKKHFHRT